MKLVGQKVMAREYTEAVKYVLQLPFSQELTEFIIHSTLYSTHCESTPVIT